MSSTQKTDESSAVLIKTDNGQQKHDYSRFEVALETRFGFALHFGFFPDFCCALAGSFRTAGERFFFSFSFLSFNASRNWELVIIAPCVVSSLVSTFFRFFSGTDCRNLSWKARTTMFVWFSTSDICSEQRYFIKIQILINKFDYSNIRNTPIS